MAEYSNAAKVIRQAHVLIKSEADIVDARQQGRTVAEQTGFIRSSELAAIATAISELARNIVDYALPGEIVVRPINQSRIKGVEIVARDKGPGIPDLDEAMLDGFSTGGGLGLGLPGVRRLTDEFEIQSVPGKGTTVKARKWIP